MQESTPQNHSLRLDDRAALSLTGLTDIDRFDDREIVIFTACGELTITGRELRITAISIEDGSLTVEGDIWSMLYGDKDKRAPLSFLGRLFR